MLRLQVGRRGIGGDRYVWRCAVWVTTQIHSGLYLSAVVVFCHFLLSVMGREARFVCCYYTTVRAVCQLGFLVILVNVLNFYNSIIDFTIPYFAGRPPLFTTVL